jgi:adenylate cyclase class 2
MAGKGRETEIKLPARDAQSARRMLYRAGFRVSRRRTFEDNRIFDTPELTLRSASTLLRLREAGGRTIVTYKGKPVPSIKHKSREELEVGVTHPAMARRIFERLGFRQTFRYQKYRTEYKQGSGPGTATLDETPIGIYLELEGPPGWIDRTARSMGFAEKDYILASYGRLYLEWAERNRREPGDMVW